MTHKTESLDSKYDHAKRLHLLGFHNVIKIQSQNAIKVDRKSGKLILEMIFNYYETHNVK